MASDSVTIQDAAAFARAMHADTDAELADRAAEVLNAMDRSELSVLAGRLAQLLGIAVGLDEIDALAYAVDMHEQHGEKWRGNL